MKNHKNTLYPILLAVLALVIAVIAMIQAKSANDIALSEIVVEEKNHLVTPVYDENSKTYSYLAIYEISFTNNSGPQVIVEKIEKIEDGGGYFVALKGKAFSDADLGAKAFIVEPSLKEIAQSPKLLKKISSREMGAEKRLNIPLGPAKTQTLRIGVSLNPYDQNDKALANMVLLSFRFEFSNGKTSVFRRGFPIQPIRQQ